jgi:hypothetical protein
MIESPCLVMKLPAERVYFYKIFFFSTVSELNAPKAYAITTKATVPYLRILTKNLSRD